MVNTAAKVLPSDWQLALQRKDKGKLPVLGFWFPYCGGDGGLACSGAETGGRVGEA